MVSNLLSSKDILQILIIPIFVSVIALIIEYWFFQPREDSKASKASPRSRNWKTLTEKAIKQFKRQKTRYYWEEGHESINIESSMFGKEHGVLIITVITHDTWRIPFGRNAPYPLAKFQLTIDRVGEILELKLIEEAQDRGTSFRPQKSKLSFMWSMVMLMTFFCAFSGACISTIIGSSYGVIVGLSGEVINKQFLDIVFGNVVQIIKVGTIIGAIVGAFLGLIVRWMSES